MTFTTLSFLLFLPLVFTLYWSCRRRSWQNLLLVIASYLFYGWWDYRFCGLMLATSLVDFGVGLGLNRFHAVGRRRVLLATSLVANLGMLGFFKYFNFFAESLQGLADSVGWRLDPILLRVILPVGISFYTFQTLGYTIDVYRGKLRATHELVDYLAYVSFFPQLVAGPIERATRLLTQFTNDRTFDESRAVDGCRLILWGFFKKLVIADHLAPFVDATFDSMGAASGPLIAFATVAFAFQIYCDFSAYSDIAIGTARLFGIQLMRNFAYPYFSLSLTEFWRRWHISLSTWFRDYVYIPLGGNRGTRARIVRNVLITFVVSGLWHGASWNFVLWGAIMGLWLAVEIYLEIGPQLSATDTPVGEGVFPGLRAARRMALTFLIVCLGWIFFRAPTLADAVLALQKIAADLFSLDAYRALFETLGTRDGRRVPLLIGAVVVIEWLTRRDPHPFVLPRLRKWQRWTVYTVVLWLVLFTGPKDTSSFIYFQF